MDTSVVVARVKGEQWLGTGAGGQKEGNGGIYSSVNNKNKLKIIIKPQLVKDFPQ